MIWVTVCTTNREPWLTQHIVLEHLEVIWLHEATTWLVSDYLLMPDHMHFFCASSDLNVTIEKWIGFWKSRFSTEIKNPAWRFQSGGFHHRIRSGTEYPEKWNYMMQNPIRKNLVDRIEDWPWKGRIHDIRWE
ncbi:transposase [Pedosphaera parvula]|nr:transposase [Pedosphaera parvula]